MLNIYFFTMTFGIFNMFELYSNVALLILFDIAFLFYFTLSANTW